MIETVTVFRIAPDTRNHMAHDLSGRAAALAPLGRRWNREGISMVYTSTTRALACLETIVHLAAGHPLPLNRFLVHISIPRAQWDRRAVFKRAEHLGWDALPAGYVSLDWGTNWIKSNATLLAEVPSVIVPEESNVLINPEHPAAPQLNAVKVRKWDYDLRLVGLRESE